MNKIIVFEKSRRLLPLLKRSFQGNSTFELLGGCSNLSDLFNLMGKKTADTLLLSHQGVLDFSMMKSIESFYPATRMIGVYFNERVMKDNIHPLIKAESQPLIPDKSIDQYLLFLNTVHFTKS